MGEPQISDTCHTGISIPGQDRTVQDENRRTVCGAETGDKGQGGSRTQLQSAQRLNDCQSAISAWRDVGDGANYDVDVERKDDFRNTYHGADIVETNDQVKSSNNNSEITEFPDLDRQHGDTMDSPQPDGCQSLSLKPPLRARSDAYNDHVGKILRSIEDDHDHLGCSNVSASQGKDEECRQDTDCRPDEKKAEDRSLSSQNVADHSNRDHNRQTNLHKSSSWIRIRNTLKAAGEMQVSKKQKHVLDREDSFLKKFSTRNHQDSQNVPVSSTTDEQKFIDSSSKWRQKFVIQHDGTFMFYWLGVVTVAVLYNLWTCIARQAFHEIQEGCPPCWYAFDVFFDIIYVFDIVIQFRTGYLDQGLMVYNSKKLRQNYTKSRVIYIDFLCLAPLDFLQLALGVHPMIRFPRFLKVYRTLRFLYMLESRTAYPNLFRVANLMHLVLLGAHWFAAFYYMISEAEKFTGKWAYPEPVGEFADISRKYLKSLYWATITLTTIGDASEPGNINQYAFVIMSYLVGVFVFATIVGQVGNVINNRNASRLEFERLLDGAKVYMQTHNVPHNLQKRVQRWYDYVWSRGRLNGCDINSLGLLPDKLKTELAIHVNLVTLKKVTIFQECQPEFLHDLVLKMKAYIFTPGDLICRRGEVAREMFIIADGVVEIISETGVMLKRMGAGDFFGEIGILNLDGGINKRTADVRSVGYLELFVLSREDVLEALKDHPEAEFVIREYGQRRLREVEAHRMRIKPLSSPESREQGGFPSSTPQTAPNRFLQSLKSWNSSTRRQSGLVHKNKMSPLAAAPVDHQRCVAQRNSPPSRVISNVCNSSSSAQSDLAIVSVDRMDFSTGKSTDRLSQGSKEKRMRFGYLRGAYVKFRRVLNRRRDQRYSLDVYDTPRLEFIENQRLFKSTDDNSISVDVSNRSCSFKSGYRVTLNTEECSGSHVIESETDNSKNKNCSNDRDKTTEKSLEVERKSLLVPEYQTMVTDTGGQGQKRGPHRKHSNQISYIPVPTEDVDETRSTKDCDGPLDRTTTSQSQIILDVGKINRLYNGERTWRKYGGNTLSGAGNISSVPAADSIFLTASPCISSVTGHNSEIIDHRFRNRNTPSTPSFIDASRKYSISERADKTFYPTQPSVAVISSCNYEPNVKAGSLDTSDSMLFSSVLGENCRSRSDGVTSARTTRKPPDDSQLTTENTERTSNYLRSDQVRSADCHSDVASSVSTRHFCSSLASSSQKVPFPSHQNGTDEPVHKVADCTRLESSHLNQSSSSTAVSSTGNTDTPTVSTISTSRINGTVPEVPTPVSYSAIHQLVAPRSSGKNYDHDDHFVLDELSPERSSTASRFKQEVSSPTIKRQESGSSGRSQAMSIIQQLTTDVSYQQLATEMSGMQEMIDRRLSVLEDAFSSTSAQLDRLAASQDILLQLLTQHAEGRSRPRISHEVEGSHSEVSRI